MNKSVQIKIIFKKKNQDKERMCDKQKLGVDDDDEKVKDGIRLTDQSGATEE